MNMADEANDNTFDVNDETAAELMKRMEEPEEPNYSLDDVREETKLWLSELRLLNRLEPISK